MIIQYTEGKFKTEPIPAEIHWLENDADAMAAPLQAAVIGLKLPAYKDGRAYSQAAILRRRGFTGDILIQGEVLYDQIHMLVSVGVTMFDMQKNDMLFLQQRVQEFQHATQEMRHAYQYAVSQPNPIWQKRHSIAAMGTITA